MADESLVTIMKAIISRPENWTLDTDETCRAAANYHNHYIFKYSGELVLDRSYAQAIIVEWAAQSGDGDEADIPSQ